MRSVLLLVAACGATAAPRPHPRATTEPQDTPAPVRAESAHPTPVETLPEVPPSRLLADLTAHPEEASFFWADAEGIDLGGPAGARHTLGGWSTSLASGVLDGVNVLVTTGRQGKLPISCTRQAGQDTWLWVEGRAVGGGPVQLYIGDRHVGELELPAEGWGVGQVRIPAALLRRGENVLLLRARRSRSIPGLGRVGVALRRLAFGPELPFERLRLPALQDGRWRIPAQWRVGYTLPIGEGAQLRGRATRGTVRLRVVHDDGARELGRYEGAFAVSLAELAGRVVRIEVGAAEEPAEVAELAVEVPAEDAASAPRPTHVILWLVDTLRADHLSPINPRTRVRTPGLEAFVRDASTFMNAHAQENWTKPSVATLLSGLMPWEHTATQQSSVVPRSIELLPEMLRAQGFETASFICNGYVSDRFGFDQGWDTYRNYIREGRRTRARDVAADVLAWLDGRDETKPFFLYVHTIDPHVPYRPPREYLGMYGDTDYSGVVNFRRNPTLLEDIKLGRLRLRGRDKAHLRALYDGEISYHDAHFRSVMEGLRRRGLADTTMVVVTSDHGEEFWDHGSVGHGHSVYEELLHVPLFVRLPGLPAARIASPVGLVDVVPTILDALGKPIPATVSGRSFLDTLERRGAAQPRVTVSGFMDSWRTATSGRWKLVLRPGRRPRLYDLQEDPGERVDVAAERPLTARWLRERMALRLEATRAQGRRSRHRHRAQSTVIDDETAAQLRALGYVTQ